MNGICVTCTGLLRKIKDVLYVVAGRTTLGYARLENVIKRQELYINESRIKACRVLR